MNEWLGWRMNGWVNGKWVGRWVGEYVDRMIYRPMGSHTRWMGMDRMPHVDEGQFSGYKEVCD